MTVDELLDLWHGEKPPPPENARAILELLAGPLGAAMRTLIDDQSIAKARELERSAGLVALYWGDGDWTCTFECGKRHGERAGWFDDPFASPAERTDVCTAEYYWEDPDSPTFSLWRDDLERGNRGGSEGDMDHLAPGTKCAGCGAQLT